MFWKNDVMLRKTAVGLLAMTMLATACAGATAESVAPQAQAETVPLVQAARNEGRTAARTSFSRQAGQLAQVDDTSPTDDAHAIEVDEGFAIDDDAFFEDVFYDEAFDWFAIAAEQLGMDEEAFWEALESGQSIAELAAAANVDVETIVTALKTAETAFVEQLVADEVLTQAEAAEWLAEADEEIRQFVEESLADLFIGVDWLAVAATTLGVDEEALWQSFDAGQTLAELAAAQGVEAAALVDAIVAAETDALNQAVADGHLTQAEADEWLSELPEDVRAFVEESWEACDEESHNEDLDKESHDEDLDGEATADNA